MTETKEIPNKFWKLIIGNQEVTLSSPSDKEIDVCKSCSIRKEIVIVSNRKGGITRKFCLLCTLDNLEKLRKNSDLVNPKDTIGEIRSFLFF